MAIVALGRILTRRAGVRFRTTACLHTQCNVVCGTLQKDARVHGDIGQAGIRDDHHVICIHTCNDLLYLISLTRLV